MEKRQLGGISLLVGNVALIANGLIGFLKGRTDVVKNAGISRVITASMWSLSGLLLARYGNRSVKDQLVKLQEKLAAFLQKEGVSLEAEQQQKATAHNQRSWFGKLEDKFYSYPIESVNVYYSLSSLGMVASGIFRRKGSKADIKSGNANLTTAALAAGGTLTAFIPELTPEQVAAKGQSGTLWGKIQERPLNYAVWMFLASDLSVGAEAVGEYEKAKLLEKTDKFRPWAHIMAGLSIFAMLCDLTSDLLTGFSSKKMGGSEEDRKKAQAQLMEETAALLAKQPEPLRQRAAAYLARQPELRMVDYDPVALNQRISQIIEERKPGYQAKLQPVSQEPVLSAVSF